MCTRLPGWYHLACGLLQARACATRNLRRTKRMRKGITILLFGMLALSAPPSADRLWGQTEKKDALPDPAVKVGDMAPDFTLMDTHRNQVSLHDFRGKKNVALAFYIFAFTGG
jgi:hypothetical protein